MILAVLNQKGGAGKSTLVRAIATEYSRAGWKTLVADTDRYQRSSQKWSARRAAASIEPAVEVQEFARVEAIVSAAENYNLVVIDGAPAADRMTAQCAQAADLILIPTGTSIDDLEPSLNLGRELQDGGIIADKIMFVLLKTTNSHTELRSAAQTVKRFGFSVANGYVPYSTGYSTAQDAGRSITETSYPALNDRAGKLMQKIIDKINDLMK